ncbi:MAG: hypothetical protein ABIR56_11645 [Polaromonas sp.]
MQDHDLIDDSEEGFFSTRELLMSLGISLLCVVLSLIATHLLLQWVRVV